MPESRVYPIALRTLSRSGKSKLLGAWSANDYNKLFNCPHTFSNIRPCASAVG